MNTFGNKTLRRWGPAVLLILSAGALRADPLTRKTDIDFFHSVSSRNLHGLATRSDGRLVAGPVFVDIAGEAPAELLWCLQPAPDGKWLVGTGPEGEIFEVSVDAAKRSFSARQLVRLDDPQVFALRRLADGSILAGTSPKGGLDLVQNGKLVARAALPADSIFDILPLDEQSVLVATGNPGRIYRVALGKFAASGVAADRLSDSALAARGIALFGEIRDRNVRRLARLADGRIAAGSAPKGNVYLFPAGGGAPVILEENFDSEVTDLLPQADGSFLAAVVHGGAEARSAPVESKVHEGPGGAIPPPAQPEKFMGRSSLLLFPADGFPEGLLSRGGSAYYRLGLLGRTVLIAGGDQGDLGGFDLDSQLAMTFAGSSSARINDLEPIPGTPGSFLALRNNGPGFGLIEFGASGAREATTDIVDLGTPGKIGALRFNRIRDLSDRQLDLSLTASNGSDALEGWTPWAALRSTDGGWRAADIRGRYVRLRLRWAADAAPSAELDRASLYSLPKNRRPILQDFRILPPNLEIVAAPEPPPTSAATLAQLLEGRDDDKHKSALLSSPVVSAPGFQAFYWSVAAPEGDNLLCTLSVRRDGDSDWTDVAVHSRDSYAQFDTSHLADGLYFVRLVASEAAPRPPADRLSATFQTDVLVVDHSPPELLEASAVRRGDSIVVSVHGRDSLSLLDRIEVAFNNGVGETVEQPEDGIRDGRDKTFVLDEPLAKAAGATNAEVTLYDAAGNSASRRLAW